MALDLLDKTSNGNNLTNNGAAEAAGILGVSAADLESGESDYLSAADSASLSLSTTGSILLWINPESTPSSGNKFVLVAKDDTSGQRSYQFILNNSGGTLRLEAAIFGNSTSDNFYWNWTPTVGTNYHLGLTFDSTQASATTFVVIIDGVSQGNGTSINSGNVATIDDTTALLTIGTFGVTPESFFDGKIDDLRIYNTVLTAAQIAAVKDSEALGTETGLIAYWPFNALSGNLDLTSKIW